MKRFWKYWFPPLYGLLVYATIRLVNDAAFKQKFWERSWLLNAFEISTCALVGYLMTWSLNRLFAYFERTPYSKFELKSIGKEVLFVTILTEVLMWLTIMPMAAFSDDGLSSGDIAMISVIPLLYAIILYG